MSGYANPIERALRIAGAFSEGHFVLTSWRHTGDYVDAGTITPDPEALLEACRFMAPHFVDGSRPDFFACPAEAAIGLNEMLALAYNQARPIVLGITKARAIYASKDPEHDGGFSFRRGQDQGLAGKSVVVIDDLGTTGKSVKGVVKAVEAVGGIVVEVAYLAIRGQITSVSVGDVARIWTPLQLNLLDYEHQDCPLCSAGIPVDLNHGHGREYMAKYGQPTEQNG